MIKREVVSRRSRLRRFGAPTVLLTMVLVAAACSGNGRSTGSSDTTPTSAGGGSGSGTAQPIIDTSACPGSLTTGVNGNTITIGTSLPQSGFYAAFSSILKGEQAYINYTNKNGGVTVAGKKYQIKLIAKDDGYDASRTVTNVQSLINDDKVFALFNVVGTKNNLAIRNMVNQQCVPDLFAASGATQWGNHNYPWLIGSELVPYPLEVNQFVNYLKQKKPDATIAVLRADDDFGQSYTDTLKELVKGTDLKIVQVQQYANVGAAVGPQVNSLAATHADAFLLAAALLACPAALTAAADAGWHPITYMSGTCVSKVLLSSAGAAANGLFTVTPLLDPADPNNDSNPAMQLYKEQFNKYYPPSKDNDVQDGIVAYGWTTGALLVKTLESSPKLDRGSVMEAARTITNFSDVGLQIPAAKWNTSADDWFIGETFQYVQYDSTSKHTTAVGPLTDDDGKTESLTPEGLINQ